MTTNPYPPLTPEELARQLANERANVAVLVEAAQDAQAAIREIRLADGHAARTGDESRFDRALAALCTQENALRAALSSVEGGR